MKLDRNLTPGHVGKYALVKLREVPAGYPKFTEESTGNEFCTFPSSCLEFGQGEQDFFVIRLKDKYAAVALAAYSEAARADDPEYADQVLALAIAAVGNPLSHKPD